MTMHRVIFENGPGTFLYLCNGLMVCLTSLLASTVGSVRGDVGLINCKQESKTKRLPFGC